MVRIVKAKAEQCGLYKIQKGEKQLEDSFLPCRLLPLGVIKTKQVVDIPQHSKGSATEVLQIKYDTQPGSAYKVHLPVPDFNPYKTSVVDSSLEGCYSIDR